MKKEKLFQISEAAHACGISRSTMLRMEERGLLTPAVVSEESGRRYYDNYDIARVLQVEKFQSMGLTNREISAYYQSGGEIETILAPLEERLSDLTRSVAELRIRAKKKATIVVEEITLPKTICRMRRTTGNSTADKFNAMYAFYTECIKEGCVLSSEPLFDIQERSDFLSGTLCNEPYPFYVCVPLAKPTADSVVLPACRALSVLYYGEYRESEQSWLVLGKELKKRRLKHCGLPRAYGLVAAYSGREIAEPKYCSRFVIPVEDESPDDDDREMGTPLT